MRWRPRPVAPTLARNLIANGGSCRSGRVRQLHLLPGPRGWPLLEPLRAGQRGGGELGERLQDFKAGLRCHDVHAGLRSVDPNSATLTPLADTRMVGMAASLASLVRGQDIISDAEALKAIVAEQLDISPYAFVPVVETLERVGM